MILCTSSCGIGSSFLVWA